LFAGAAAPVQHMATTQAESSASPKHLPLTSSRISAVALLLGHHTLLLLLLLLLQGTLPKHQPSCASPASCCCHCCEWLQRALLIPASASAALL
jgi:hypothetical protein